MPVLVYKAILLVVTMMVGITGVLYYIQDHDSDDCDIFDLRHNCDLSGWITLIYGDLLIGVTLALVFHYLVSGSNKKIEAATLKTDQIITEMKRLRDRRETYVIQALKNHFSSLLLCIGMINNFMDSQDEKRRRIADEKRTDLERILRKAQAVLDLSIDVLDPMTIEKIDKLFTLMGDSMAAESKDMKIQNVDGIKAAIKEITVKLDEYEHSGNVLK